MGQAKNTKKRPFKGWIASLNNGQTVFEKHPDDWLKLQERLRKENIKIVQLRLQHGIRTITSIYKADEYFQSNRNIKGEFWQGIGVIRDGIAYVCWMNKQGDIWQDIFKVTEVSNGT